MLFIAGGVRTKKKKTLTSIFYSLLVWVLRSYAQSRSLNTVFKYRTDPARILTRHVWLMVAASCVVIMMETNSSFAHVYSLKILLRRREIDPLELDFLLRFPVDHTYSSPVDFLTAQSWSAVKVREEFALSVLKFFLSNNRFL